MIANLKAHQNFIKKNNDFKSEYHWIMEANLA